MKKTKILIIFIFIFSFSFVNIVKAGNFKIENGKVYYNTGHDVYEIINGADASSFKFICFYYSKDNYNAFYVTKMIKNADAATFKCINDYYAKDKNNIYFGDKIMVGADINSFITLASGNPYAKDKNFVYYTDSILKGADTNTFKVLDKYALDKNFVYWVGSKVDGADVGSFQELKNEYAKDKNNYYFGGNKITNLIEINNAKELEKNGFIFNKEQNHQYNKLFNKLKGQILLKVEDKGEAYYLNPTTFKISYLGRPNDAFFIMQEQGVGITNSNLEKIPVADNYCPDYNKNCNNTNKYNLDFASQQKGKIFLQIQGSGEAWYVNPKDNKRYFLGRPADAFNVMRNLGLGISNSDFDSLSK